VAPDGTAKPPSTAGRASSTPIGWWRTTGLDEPRNEKTASCARTVAKHGAAFGLRKPLSNRIALL